MPKPAAILGRVLVILSRPLERPQLGENILAFLKAMGPVLHPAVGDRWDDVVPKLINYLKGACCAVRGEGRRPMRKHSACDVPRVRALCGAGPNRADKSDSPEKWVQPKWEELIVKFLVKTIEDVNDDEWTVNLCEEMTKQFPLYQGTPQLKVRGRKYREP